MINELLYTVSAIMRKKDKFFRTMNLSIERTLIFKKYNISLILCPYSDIQVV